MDVGGSASEVLNSCTCSIVSACHIFIELSLPMVTRVPDVWLWHMSTISS